MYRIVMLEDLNKIHHTRKYTKGEELIVGKCEIGYLHYFKHCIRNYGMINTVDIISFEYCKELEVI